MATERPTKSGKGGLGGGRVPQMSLPALQERLNKDAKLKKAFLADPTGTLRAQGYELNAEQARTVEYLVDRVKRPGRMVPGAGVAPQDLAAITITIGVDF